MNHKISILLILVLFCMIGGLARAVDPNSVTQYEQAQKFFAAKNYTEAQRVFQELLQKQPQNGYLQYNLGNVYLQMGQMGEAIQYYEKARQTEPRLLNLRENLKLARSKVAKAQSEASLKEYLEQTFYFWNSWLTQSEYRLITIILSCLFWLFLIWGVLRKKRVVSIRGVLFTLIFLYLVGGAFLKSHASQPGRFGIILAPTVDVKASFVDESSLFEISEGTKVQLLETHTVDQTQTWVKVMLPNGQRGWVLASQVGVI